jgi:hypothetical protein
MTSREPPLYRTFARLAREQAEASHYPEVKRALLKIAAEYERLAEYVESVESAMNRLAGLVLSPRHHSALVPERLLQIGQQGRRFKRLLEQAKRPAI